MTMPAQKPGRSKQDYRTPACFLDAVRERLHIVDFDIDLAADDHNAVCGLYYTKEVNALEMPWRVDLGPGWNWLNPPFDNIGNFARKAACEWVGAGARTAMLVPASVGANWWRDYVHGLMGVQALFLNGRITFVGCEDPYPKDCALVLYGMNWSGRQQYDVWSWTK